MFRYRQFRGTSHHTLLRNMHPWSVDTYKTAMDLKINFINFNLMVINYDCDYDYYNYLLPHARP